MRGKLFSCNYMCILSFFFQFQLFLMFSFSCRLYKLLHKGKVNERIFFNLGMLAMDDKEIQLAEKWFKKAVQVMLSFLFFFHYIVSQTLMF